MRSAVILAGGLGTRLQPFTQAIPKPLLPIGEKAILEIQISRLASSGFKEVFIAANYKADYISSFLGDGSRFGVKLTVSKEETPLGTCGALSLLRGRMLEPFVVMNGDILTTIDFCSLYEFGVEVRADFTVVTKEIVMPFAFGNVFTDGTFVTGVEEKPDIRNEIVAGIYVMKPPVFRYIPDGQYFGMDTLIKSMLKNNLPVARYLMKEFWLDIGRIEDYRIAEEAYKEHFQDDTSAEEEEEPLV